MALTTSQHIPGMRIFIFTLCLLQVVLLGIIPGPVSSQQPTDANVEQLLEQARESTSSKLQVAPVVVAGEVLFELIGIDTFPAEERAERVAAKIMKLALDSRYKTNSMTIVEHDIYHDILSAPGNKSITRIFNEDAELLGIDREIVAGTFRHRIKISIENYRHDHEPDVVRNKLLMAALIISLFVAGIYAINWGFRSLVRLADQHIKSRVMALETKSVRIIEAEQIWSIIQKFIRLIRLAIILITSYLALSTVLSMFPGTRYVATNLLAYVIDPLQSMVQGILDYIPSLIYLVILFVVFRYILVILYKFFTAIDRERLQISGFDAEWAFPTYRIIRLVVILFALVLAYPYIPGSDSEAFQGISIMIGVLFSLGSTSVISNIIAGYTMTYRKAFRIGDRVTIGGTTGDVMEMRVLVTHIRSLKNEEVIIPNSTILNNEVINYSKMSEEHGLILHTTVGIGYEVPWRQVEAMLKQAADRTPGMLKQPEPFVLQTGLNDFAVNYELNVYCKEEKKAMELYTVLHRNIQDVFNEYGIQIMTPNYIADTPDAKIVPKDQWYAPPAKPPAVES